MRMCPLVKYCAMARGRWRTYTDPHTHSRTHRRDRAACGLAYTHSRILALSSALLASSCRNPKQSGPVSWPVWTLLPLAPCRHSHAISDSKCLPGTRTLRYSRISQCIFTFETERQSCCSLQLNPLRSIVLLPHQVMVI